MPEPEPELEPGRTERKKEKRAKKQKKKKSKSKLAAGKADTSVREWAESGGQDLKLREWMELGGAEYEDGYPPELSRSNAIDLVRAPAEEDVRGDFDHGDFELLDVSPLPEMMMAEPPPGYGATAPEEAGVSARGRPEAGIYDEPDVAERARRRLEAARSSRRDGEGKRERVAKPAAVAEPAAAELPVREASQPTQRRAVFSEDDEDDGFEQLAQAERFERVANADAVPGYEEAEAAGDGFGEYDDTEWLGLRGHQSDEQEPQRQEEQLDRSTSPDGPSADRSQAGSTDDDEQQLTSSEDDHDDEEEERRRRQWERQQPRDADEERRRWERQQPRAPPPQQPRAFVAEPSRDSPESRAERKRIEKVGATRGRRPSTVFKLGNMMGDLRGQLASLKGMSIGIADEEGGGQVQRMDSIDSENSFSS